jgi:hypothetical protein
LRSSSKVFWLHASGDNSLESRCHTMSDGELGSMEITCSLAPHSNQQIMPPIVRRRRRLGKPSPRLQYRAERVRPRVGKSWIFYLTSVRTRTNFTGSYQDSRRRERSTKQLQERSGAVVRGDASGTGSTGSCCRRCVIQLDQATPENALGSVGQRHRGQYHSSTWTKT